MSFNIKKSLEVDYLAARTISSRDFQTNQNAPPGYVLTATSNGNARWVISPPVNAFSYIVLPDLSYSTIVGFNEESLNTFQLQASEPLTLSVVSSINRIIVGGDFSNFVSVASLTSTVSAIVGTGGIDFNIPLTSTVAGLGQTYVSIASLTSTVAGIRADPVDISIPLASTTAGLGQTYVSIPSLTSTVAGLGKTYVSIPSLTSTVAGLGQTYVSIPSLTSTVSGLGDSLTSTVAGLGQTYVSIPSLTSTVSGLGDSLTSTVAGLGQTYVSIPSLTSTVSAFEKSLQSTVAGLGQTYVSIPSLTSTVAGLSSNPVDISIPLTSTVAGLGQIYISIPSLTSTVAGLSANPVDISIPLASTVAGLGQTYVSIPSLASTVAGLGQTYISVPSLTSTVAGLGQTYVSIPSLTSTMIGISNNLYVSSLTTSTFTVTDNARITYISTLGISSASITAGVGSAAAPSYSFGGDTNNGIFSPSADIIAVTTGGVERLRVDDVGRVGVGKSAGTGYVLDVSGTINAANYGDLYCISGANVSQAGGTLAFGIAQFPNYLPMSQLKGVLVNSAGTELQGGITFSTRPFNAGASGQLMTERMRINEDGTIGIGSNITTTATLDVSGTTRVRGNVAIGRTVNAGFGLDVSGIVRADYFSTISISSGFIVAGTGSAAAPSYSFAGNATAGIYRPSADTFAITTAGVERMRVDSGGRVGIGRTPATGYALDVSGGYGRIQNYVNDAGFELLAGGTFSIRRVNGANGDAQLYNFGTGSVNFATNGTSGRMVIDGSGSVAIGSGGVVNSAAKVTIQDDLCLVTGANSSGAGGSVYFGIGQFPTYSPMSQIKGLLTNQTGSEVQGGIGFYTRPFGSAGQLLTERMRITNDGFIGVGTSTIVAPMMICRDSLYNINTTGGQTWGENNNPSQLLLTGLTNTNKRLAVGYNTISDVAAIQSLEYTAGAKNLLINPLGGNIGIGTTTITTGYSLDITGTQRLQQFATQTASASPVLQLNNSLNTDRLDFYTRLSGGSYNSIVATGDKAIIFSDNSNFNTSAGLVIAPHRNGASGIRIDSNGNVGVGRTPVYNLDISGTARFTSGGSSQFEISGNELRSRDVTTNTMLSGRLCCAYGILLSIGGGGVGTYFDFCGNNVSQIEDRGSGYYRIYLSINLRSDGKYTVVANGNGNQVNTCSVYNQNSNYFDVITVYNNNGFTADWTITDTYFAFVVFP